MNLVNIDQVTSDTHRQITSAETLLLLLSEQLIIELLQWPRLKIL